MTKPSRRMRAAVISVLLIVAAIALTAAVFVLSDGRVLVVVLPLIAPGVILLAWSALSGRSGGPEA